jgi:hypothetical protein
LSITFLAARNGERQAARAEAAKRISFREAAGRYIAAQRAGCRTGDNPARWRGHLDKLLPEKTLVR